MQNDRIVYRVLVRHFFNRLFDSELIASGGSLAESAATVLGLLWASGIPVAWVTVNKHWLMSIRTPEAIRQAVTWSDREFLISMSMAIMGAVAIFCWESVFPDRRDCLILSGLPLRPSLLMGAKLTTLAGTFVATTVMANFVTTFFFPIATMFRGTVDEGLLAYASHIITVGSASAFVFLTMLAVQGLLANLLPYRVFQRASAWVQLLALFGILFLFFVIPPIASLSALTAPQNRQTALWLPPFWFLGLYQKMLGTQHPFIDRLAGLALCGLAISAVSAGVLYAIGYRRLMRRTIEEAGTVGDSGVERWVWLENLLDRVFLNRSTERAAFHFVWRTMTRNRGHRLMLAAYAATGLVYVVEGIANLLQKGGGHALLKPNVELSAFALILPFFVLLGLRALFAMPVELKANWIFRLTDLGRPDEYVRGARKLMLLAGIFPVCLASVPLYVGLWGWRVGASHAFICLVAMMAVLELLMARFRKVPFTCPFLPGKNNMKVLFGVYVVLFLVIAFALVHIELWLTSEPRRAAIGMALACGVLLYGVRKRKQGEAEDMGIMWEESPVWHMQTLELSR